MRSVFDLKKDCCGCSSCANICPTNAIKMLSDEEGFLYPEIDSSKCIDCGLCRKICTFKNDYDRENSLKEPLVYACKNKNEERLKQE